MAFEFLLYEGKTMSTESKCNCQHCSGHISFPAEMAGQMTVCPHCGLETKLYVPAIPQDVRVEIKRGASPLGIAALVLGIISCLFCWIPFLGLLVVPLGLIGLLLAFVGLIMAGVSKKTGFVFPISGAVVCLLSVFIAFAITGGLAAAFQKALTEGKKTNQETESKSTNQKASEVEEWSKSMTVKQGDIEVSVTGPHIGPVQYLDSLNRPQVTDEQYSMIQIFIKNLSTTKKIDFETWRGAASLTDNNGNNYKQISITPNWNLTPISDSVSIYPQTEQIDNIAFELPVGNIEWLHLELPAEKFGGNGMLRFEIPMK